MKKLILRINGIVEHPARDLEIAEHDKIVDALLEAVDKLGFDFGFVADNAVVDEHGELFTPDFKSMGSSVKPIREVSGQCNCPMHELCDFCDDNNQCNFE